MTNESETGEYGDIATEYDLQVHDYDSYGHDVLFGMCFEFVQAGESMLDLAIGTGLASRHFADIGLRISGLDISDDMLEGCREKNFSQDLRLHDLRSGPLPYENVSFDHVICCGAFHFFENLDSMFSEVRRVSRSGGIFAYTTYPLLEGKGVRRETTDWGVDVIAHAPSHISTLLQRHEFELLKEQRLLIKGHDRKTYSMPFSAQVCRIR